MNNQVQLPERSNKVSYKEPPLPSASLVIWIIGIGFVGFIHLGMVV